jgi:hypothetical protein
MTDHSDPCQTARAKPARRIAYGQTQSAYFRSLAGKSTFAADTGATATRIVQGASGLAEARNQTVGSNTYCNLGSIAYPAVASIV